MLCKASCADLISVVQEKLVRIGCKCNITKAQHVDLNFIKILCLLEIVTAHRSRVNMHSRIVSIVDIPFVLLEEVLNLPKGVILFFNAPTEQQFLGATYTVKNQDVYNDIIIKGESLTEYGNVAGRASNYDPASDTNINLIGMKTYREAASGYYSRRQCEDLAKFKLKRQTVLQKSVSISSSQLFHIQENQLVTILRPDKPGMPMERHLITGFTRPIGQTGQMTIQATSVQDFPIATIMPLPGET